MRFMIQCADGTVKWVSEDEGKAALLMWGQGRPIILKNSLTGIAAHMISKISSYKEWIDQEQAVAAKERMYICKYARRHKYDERCTCGQLRNPPEKLLPEECKMLQIAGPRSEQHLALPEAPPTPEEIEKRKQYEQKRDVVLRKMSIPEPKKIEADPGCKECGGKGSFKLEGVDVTCNCIVNAQFATRKEKRLS